MKKVIILGALAVLASACGSKTTTQSSSSATDASSSTSSSLTPVQITEWGVQFTPVQSISDVRYAIDSNHEDTADFSTASLVSLDQQSGGSKCAVTAAPLGQLSRVVDFSAYTSSGHTTPPSVKIGDYYYFYTGPQGSCSNNFAVQNLQTLQAGDFSSVAISTLKAISSK